VCSYGLTIGESYVPFNPDEDDDTCDEEESFCSQMWVRVMDISPAPAPDGFGGDSCSVDLNIHLEVGIIRCVHVPDGGEAPTTTDVLEATMQSMHDMATIQCAAFDAHTIDTETGRQKDIWGSILLGTWVPNGPLGGQYGGVWDFTVAL
jgi:hypothetical protein